MKRREFLEKSLAIGGLSLLQPWQILRMLGADSYEDALSKLLDFDLEAEAAPVQKNFVSRPFKIIPGMDIRDGVSILTTNAAISGDGTSSLVENTDTQFIKNGGSKNFLCSLNPGTLTQIHDIRNILPTPLSMSASPTISLRMLSSSGLNNLLFYLCNDTATSVRFQYNEASHPNAAVSKYWKFLTWHRDGNSGTAGSPTFDNVIQTIRFGPSTGAGNPATFYLDQIMYDGYQRPVIVWILEGGSSSHYTVGYNAWTSKLLTGTLAIPTNVVDTGGFLTTSQINEMYNAGWDVIHMTDSTTALTGLSVSQVETRLATAENFLISKGWTRTLKHCALPGTVVSLHRSDANVLTALANRGYVSAIDKWMDGGTGSNITPISVVDPDHGISLAPYGLPAWRTENPDTITEHTDHVKHVIRAGGVRILRTGAITGSPVSGQIATADHTTLLNTISLYHHANTLSALPYRQFIAGIEGRRLR